MSRIHERNPLGFGGIGHSQKRSVADERFFDEDMFARRYRRECSLFLRSRRNTNVDGVNVRTVQQVIETFYCRNTLAFGYKSLRSVNLAARNGNQFAIRRFVYRISDDAGDHSSSNNAESKLRHIHKSNLLAKNHCHPTLDALRACRCIFPPFGKVLFRNDSFGFVKSTIVDRPFVFPSVPSRV